LIKNRRSRENWSAGVVEYWSGGVMEYWSGDAVEQNLTEFVEPVRAGLIKGFWGYIIFLSC